jgi:hypothetical protein
VAQLPLLRGVEPRDATDLSEVERQRVEARRHGRFGNEAHGQMTAGDP